MICEEIAVCLVYIMRYSIGMGYDAHCQYAGCFLAHIHFGYKIINHS